MSEGAKKVVMEVLYAGLDKSNLTDKGIGYVNVQAAKIDTAVAPLVTVLERITAESQRGTSGRLIVSHANEDELKKALEQWRTGR